jgi:threonine synthase
MDQVLGLKCVLCGAEYGVGDVDYVCPKHGDEGILDVIYDYRLIGRRVNPSTLAANPDQSVWRYRDLLPVEPGSLDRLLAADSPLTKVGGTPLYRADRLAQHLGLQHVYVKDDGRLPTASFKDRASSMAVVKAVERGADVVTTASSGNAASALAGMAASIGLPTIIFVPYTAPQAKIAQLLIFGSTVILVEGTYDQAFDLTLAASKEYGWYCRNTAYNPYMSEGKKTCAFEICEQLGGHRGPPLRRGDPSVVAPGQRRSAVGGRVVTPWQAPDRIFVAVGDGCIIGGLWKGLKDLLALGWIDRMPKLMGVQAAGSAVLVDAWQRPGEDFHFLPNPETIADSISVGVPRDRVKALRAVRETGGEYLAVTDDEILEAMRVLARQTAVFAEPAGATGFAGLMKAVRESKIDPAEQIVVVVTGNGLKDVASAIKATGQPLHVAPTMENLRQVVDQMSVVRDA